MMQKTQRGARALRFLIGLVLLMLCTQMGLASAQELGGVSMSWLLEDSQDYITHEVLVRFNVERSSASGPRTALSFYNQFVQEMMPGAEAKRELTRVVSGLVVVKLPDFTSVQEAIALFNAESRVIYAEPQYRINVLAIPNDPRFPEQWNLNNEGQTGGLEGADINAPEGWDINDDAEEIIVAVVDTGVDYNHPDLYPNMWYAEGFIIPEDVNQDDPNFNPEDPNYYVRDYGPDYVDGPVNDDPNDFGVDAGAPEANGDPNDLHWHGTSVAGIIGARGNNEEGISGVAPIVKIMAIRVFDENAEIDEFGDVIDGIGFAVANGARIINLSWEVAAYNASLEAAIAGAPDVLFVCSAGDSGENLDNAIPDPTFTLQGPMYPAALALEMDHVIAVMATDHFDQPTETTNFGPLTVTIGAPGVDILTCTPQSTTDAMGPDDANLPTSYGLMSGTSAAAAHISGACALALGLDDTQTPLQLKKRLEMWRSVDQVLPELCVSEGRLVLDKFLHLFEPKIVLNVTRDIQYDSIQEAIDEAASGDDILAEANGFYSEALDFLGKSIRVRSGDPENPDDVTAIDPINTVVYDIDEAGDGFGVAFQSGETADAILLGFTIDHARDSGLFMGGSSPTIESCYVINSANSGVFCVAGSPVLQSVVIENNTTLYDGGGILAADGSVMTLQDCAVVGNIAVYSGGGVFCQNSTLAIEGSTILGNQSLDSFGGGVYSSNSPVDIVNSKFIANQAPAWEGGGLYALSSAVTVGSSTFSGNLGYDGGAVYCMDGTELAVKDCIFQSNEATFGGGAIGSTMSSVDVQSGLFVQNISDSWDGGALFFNDTSATLANCTFSDNDSLSVTGRGGVMRLENGADVQVRDSILSDNFDGAAYVHDESSFVNFDHCLFHNNERADYEEAVTGVIVKLDDPNNTGEIPGEAILSANPQFVTGHLGDFYLSQYVAGQILDVNGVPVDPDVNPDDATSPAVDAGSGLAVDLGMNMSSTRTDNLPDESGDMDSGIVDIGFHYVDAEPAHYYVMVSNAEPTGWGKVEPLGGMYVQYTQILLTATTDDPDRHMFKAWENTDDDARKELTDAGLPKPVQTNVVTMTEEKFVTAHYETVDIELRVVVDESRGNGVVTPRKVFVPRGETVTINATPDQARFRAEWHNTNDDYATGMTNTVTIEPPFKLDRNGREIKEVRVEFFTPAILNVPEQYGHIQQAIDAANSGDIVVLAPQSTPYRVAHGYSITKAITVQSARPDDPETVARTIIEMEPETTRDQTGVASKAFTFFGVEPNAVLNGVTIRGFNLEGDNGGNGGPADGAHDALPGEDVAGGAILCEFASPTIKNCVITDCSVLGGNGGNGAAGTDTDPQGGHGGAPGMGLGGAIACMTFSNPIVKDCQFINCLAIGGNGGDGGDAGAGGAPGWGAGWDPAWAWTAGAVDASYYALYYDRNVKYAGMGGAAFVDTTSAPEFVRCEFTGNSSSAGVTGVSGILDGLPYALESTNRWQIDGYAGAVSIGAARMFEPPLTVEEDGKILYVNYLTLETQEDPFCTPKFVECSFTGNDVNEPVTDRIEDFYTGYGGAVAAFADTEPAFEGCAFSDNSAPVGGAYFGENANPLFSDCDFEGNSAFHGGAIDITGGSSVIENSRFADNVADESAVYLIDPNAVAARGAIGQGGAIWHGEGTLTLQDSIIRGNEATFSGGGIYLGGGELLLHRQKLWNCLITGNLAEGNGGGLSTNHYSAPLLENCTIANNTVSGVGQGGGLSVSPGSSPKVLNSIIWGNAGVYGSQIALIGESPQFTDASASLDIRFSDIQLRRGTAAIFVDDTTHIKGWDAETQQWDPNTHNMNADPEFVMGYYLSQTDAGDKVQSPAVDAGNVDSDQTSRPLDAYTTRAGSNGTLEGDAIYDAGRVDLGYHYGEVAQYLVTAEVLPGEDGQLHGSVDPLKAAVFSGLPDNMLAVTAYPAPGYKVKQWTGTDNDNTIRTVNTVTVTQDMHVTVTFEKAARYYYTTEVVDGGDGPHGQLTPQSGWVDEGTSVVLTAQPDGGFEVGEWFNTDDDISKSNTNTVLVDANNLVVRVEFTESAAENVLTVPSDYTSIQAALEAAKSGDTIVVDPGIYQSGEGAYLITLTKDVTITSRFPSDPCSVASTILDGYANDPARPLHYVGMIVASNVGRDTVINGLTFRNCGGQAGDGVADDGDRAAGHPDGYDGQFGLGGALIILPQASPTIKNCVFQNNFMIGEDGGNGENADATANAGRGGWGGWVRGGAIYCASKSSPLFINCRILDNYAQGGNGGDGGDGALNNDIETLPNYGGNYTPGQRVFIDSLSSRVEVADEELWKLWTWDFSESYRYGLSEDAIVDPVEAANLVLTGDLGPYLGDERDYTALGGGVYCGTLSQVTFIHCDFRGNYTYGGLTGIGGLPDGSPRNIEPLYPEELPSYGGAVYCDSQSNVSFEGCTFSENEASAVLDPNNGAGDGTDVDLTSRPNPYMGYGGGVSTDVSARVTFTDCNFVDNKADIGGGIYVKDSLTDVVDSNFVRNEALQGGAFAGTGGDFMITDCNVVANRAVEDIDDPNDDDILPLGAGLYLSSCPAQVTDSNFLSNSTPGSGGAIYIRGNKPSILNCLFRNNGAGHDGGALSINNSAVATIRNVTFYHNLSDPNILGGFAETGYGGALFCGSNSVTSVTDSIFFENAAHLGGTFAVMSGRGFDDQCASLTLAYCTVTTGPNDVYTECDTVVYGDKVLWGVNPLFVAGPLGNHYLASNSPAVDAGSTTSYEADMISYTTQIDPRKDTPDTGQVDIGYHYKLAEPCRSCDLIKDGTIDGSDFGKFADLLQKWMGQECSAANNWCDGADLTYDFKVDANDQGLLELCRDVSDVTPPSPNPPKWWIQPYFDDGGVVMRAKAGEDGWWLDEVEYYFQNVSGGGHDSGWQSSPVYVDGIGGASDAYGYRFKVRDPAGNETDWSIIKHASANENVPPVGPLSLSLLDAGVTTLQLLAQEMFDVDGVQYYIEIDDDDIADSGWFEFDPNGLVPDPADPNLLIVLDPNDPNMAGPNYIFTQLEPDTSYRFRVKARDKSDSELETLWSDWVSFRTLEAPENLPPAPNPLSWDTAVDANGFPGTPTVMLVRVQAGFGFYGVRMVSILADDVDSPPVEYYFECVNNGAFSSGWVIDPTYITDVVGTQGAALNLRFRVKARDQAGNETVWSEESTVGFPEVTGTGGTGTGNQVNNGVGNVNTPIGN